MNKQIVPSGVANLLWGKIPMQDDPIHLRCDSALATNKDSYSGFFLYEMWKREINRLTGVFRLSLDRVSLFFGSSQLLAFSLAQLQQVHARSQENSYLPSCLSSFNGFLQDHKRTATCDKRRTLHKDRYSHS